MAEFNISIIKKGVEEALNEPFKDGKSILQWAEIGIHSQEQWISVKDRLPENAKHPGAFCPRYNVMTEYGVTQGWFNPDKECWFVLAWFIYAKPDFYKAQFLDMTHGDIPYVTNKIKVTHWMPLPEPPEVKQDG